MPTIRRNTCIAKVVHIGQDEKIRHDPAVMCSSSTLPGNMPGTAVVSIQLLQELYSKVINELSQPIYVWTF